MRFILNKKKDIKRHDLNIYIYIYIYFYFKKINRKNNTNDATLLH